MQCGNGASRGYAAVDAEVAADLRAVCGTENVIFEQTAALRRYSRDQIPDARYGRDPEIVVKPGSVTEVQEVMRLASGRRIPVTPRGGGSGLSGGAVPIYGGIVLSLERMDRVIEIDRDNMIAIVEPGVVTNSLDAALKNTGLFFAGYPLSEEFCFLGGNVAENAGGGRAVKYGVTGRYITGLEVVLPDGELLTVGGKRYKDVTGYDLLSLFVGSEGTLGIIVGVYIRLLPRPQYRLAVKASFPDELSALKAVPSLLRDPGVGASAVEFIDSVSISEAVGFLGNRVPANTMPRTDQALLLVEVDGSDLTKVREALRAAEDVCRTGGASEVVRADRVDEMEAVWRVRKQIPWALKRLSPDLSPEDVVVPPAQGAALVVAVRELEAKYGVRIPCFGHAADGNYHASPMRNPGMDQDEWDRVRDSLLKDLYLDVLELGGTISGEHGIGHKRRDYLPLVMQDRQIELMRRIKHAFDPRGILNPGKIF